MVRLMEINPGFHVALICSHDLTKLIYNYISIMLYSGIQVFFSTFRICLFCTIDEIKSQIQNPSYVFILQAELMTILHCSQHITSIIFRLYCNQVIICTDSLGGLNALQNFFSPSHLIRKIIDTHT